MGWKTRPAHREFETRVMHMEETMKKHLNKSFAIGVGVGLTPTVTYGLTKLIKYIRNKKPSSKTKPSEERKSSEEKIAQAS